MDRGQEVYLRGRRVSALQDAVLFKSLASTKIFSGPWPLDIGPFVVTQTLKEKANSLGISYRTAKRWRANGVDLDDPSAVAPAGSLFDKGQGTSSLFGNGQLAILWEFGLARGG